MKRIIGKWRWKIRCFGISTALIFCVQSCGSVSYATENAENKIQSNGRVVFGNQTEEFVYDSADIRTVFQSLCMQKENIMQKLISLGTKFVQTENGWQCSRNPDMVVSDLPKGNEVTWDMLFQTIQNSQTVPEDIPVREPKITLQIEGVREVTDFYKAASADNISQGKAAWQEGVLLLGTGADNESAYQKGRADGEKQHLPEGMQPIYKATEKEMLLQHQHVGNSEEKEGYSGCYHNYRTTEVKQSECGAALYQTEAVWYPNEAEEGGGSWHGGYYTCQWHNGMYSSPGKCGYVTTIEKTVWHHDIACGKTNLQYAVLKLSGEKKQPTEGTFIHEKLTNGKIVLQAELIEKEGFANLHFPEENRLVWKNETGEVIGMGTSVEVDSSGQYFCSVITDNTDVNQLTDNIIVSINGWCTHFAE